jgi:hypothetical protein
MMIVMMMAMVGSFVSVIGSSSSLVTLVNEKFIDIDALDFLLIPGWGKPSTAAAPAGGAAPTASGQHCIDTVATACKSGDSFTTSHTVDAHDACVNTTMAECIANGGTRTSANGTYPADCTAGFRVECAGKRGQERETCGKDYKKKCTGSTPSGSTPSKDVLIKKGTKCATLFEDAEFNGTKYDITTDVDATAKDQVVKTVNDISALGVKGLSSIVFEKGFQGKLCSKKYLSGECFWHDKNWPHFGNMNDKYLSLEIHYKGE